MLGFDIIDWAKEGALGNLDEVPTRKAGTRWSRVALQQFSQV
jgi:glucose/mannose transport system substrate-binding protein